MTALTLILPLKGRPLHTMRFFWHANRQGLPYRIVVADGEVEPAVAARLSPPHALFSALDIDYVRCPDDRTYQHYFDKLAAAVSRVSTPYAMLCDNDDFVVQAGVEASMAFLNDNPDYVGVSSGVAGFALHADAVLPNVAGIIRSLGSLYHDGYVAEDHTTPELLARVRHGFVDGYALYYAVFRAQALATVLRDIAALGLSDLKAVETFFGARVKTLGKCRLDRRTISYVRQAGTSGGAPDVWSLDDVAGNGARADEVQRCLAALARPIASADGQDEQVVAALLRQVFLAKAAAQAQGRADAAPLDIWREAARAIVPRGVLDARRKILRQKARDEIAAAMLAHGAAAMDVARVQQEIRAIEATLEGPEFPAFLREHASELVSPDAGTPASPAAREAV